MERLLLYIGKHPYVLVYLFLIVIGIYKLITRDGEYDVKYIILNAICIVCLIFAVVAEVQNYKKRKRKNKNRTID